MRKIVIVILIFFLFIYTVPVSAKSYPATYPTFAQGWSKASGHFIQIRSGAEYYVLNIPPSYFNSVFVTSNTIRLNTTTDVGSYSYSNMNGERYIYFRMNGTVQFQTYSNGTYYYTTIPIHEIISTNVALLQNPSLNDNSNNTNPLVDMDYAIIALVSFILIFIIYKKLRKKHKTYGGGW